jgi:hypothetical protein
VATLLARRELLPLAQVDWMPDKTKTDAKDGAMPTFFQGGSQCCIFQLVERLTAHQAAGVSITNFLTRPLAPCRSVFADKALPPLPSVSASNSTFRVLGCTGARPFMAPAAAACSMPSTIKVGLLMQLASKPRSVPAGL